MQVTLTEEEKKDWFVLFDEEDRRRMVDEEARNEARKAYLAAHPTVVKREPRQRIVVQPYSRPRASAGL